MAVERGTISALKHHPIYSALVVGAGLAAGYCVTNKGVRQAGCQYHQNSLHTCVSHQVDLPVDQGVVLLDIGFTSTDPNHGEPHSSNTAVAAAAAAAVKHYRSNSRPCLLGNTPTLCCDPGPAALGVQWLQAHLRASGFREPAQHPAGHVSSTTTCLNGSKRTVATYYQADIACL